LQCPIQGKSLFTKHLQNTPSCYVTVMAPVDSNSFSVSESPRRNMNDASAWNHSISSPRLFWALWTWLYCSEHSEYVFRHTVNRYVI